MQHEMLVLMIH